MASRVEFDNTFKELYELGSNKKQEVYLSYAVPVGRRQVTRALPISSKYAYQDPLATDDAAFMARLSTHVAPQTFSNIAGAMNLIMYDLDGSEDDSWDPQPRLDTAEVMSQFVKHQRPKVTYMTSPSDIVLPPGAVLHVTNPMDCLEHLPATVNPESHYQALSKRELALSGLPTPKSFVIDTVLKPAEAQDPALRDAEVRRMLQFIEEWPLPFVIKLPQALGGEGVFLIRSEEARSKALDLLDGEVDLMMCRLSEENAHLRPVSLIVQEMLVGTGIDIAFFITRSGEPVLTSACDQFIEHGHWDGGHISYTDQPRMHKHYMPVVKAVAEYMHNLGYFGPMGIDVMDGHNGETLVIDLNTRVSGSHALGFLKNHFHIKRGFQDAAILFAIVLNVGLAQFKRKFRREFRQGRMIIAGWCHMKGNKSSLASVIIGGEDRVRLDKLCGRVRALEVPSH
ncbi:hypothetical protein PT974_07565 [Cladobotryum mycophilum]|uniref:ATP-grasp domain-containing protein n=1 Tax=Cladobotryum mycophilum TaxID=491253 RepID=A0ABR0SQX1_9HYPO